jgi:histidine triad (HIT) family protein
MSDCVFCAILRGDLPVSLVYEDEHAIAFMDLFPWRPGHVLVIPRQHAVYLAELDADLRSHLFAIGNAVVESQKSSSLACRGNNLFVNDGRAANQSVPHVHLHILPRAGGDLVPILLSFVGRFRVYFLGMKSHRRRLDAQAKELASAMPHRVESPLARPDKPAIVP